MDNKKQIGQRLNSALAARDVRQRELAEAIGIQPNVISYFCSGTRVPNFQQLIAISNFLNISIDFLLGKTSANNLTDNVDVSTISEYTGLSNTAVARLHELTTEKTDVHHLAVDAVNMLLEDSEYGNQILSDIFEYVSERYNAVGFEQLESNDAAHIGNAVVLFENGKGIVNIPLKRIKAVFQSLITENLHFLHDKYHRNANT